jgi:hypothetical protein
MRHRSALAALPLLLAGPAAADPETAPALDASALWAPIEHELGARLQRIVDAKVDGALRQHRATPGSLVAARRAVPCAPPASLGPPLLVAFLQLDGDREVARHRDAHDEVPAAHRRCGVANTSR